MGGNDCHLRGVLFSSVATARRGLKSGIEFSVQSARSATPVRKFVVRRNHCLRARFSMAKKKAAATLPQIAASLGEPPFMAQQMTSLITAIHNYVADHPSDDWFYNVFFPLYVQGPSVDDPAAFPNRFEGAVTVLKEFTQSRPGLDD